VLEKIVENEEGLLSTQEFTENFQVVLKEHFGKGERIQQ